jgi:hypothetical protein
MHVKKRPAIHKDSASQRQKSSSEGMNALHLESDKHTLRISTLTPGPSKSLMRLLKESDPLVEKGRQLFVMIRQAPKSCQQES